MPIVCAAKSVHGLGTTSSRLGQIPKVDTARELRIKKMPHDMLLRPRLEVVCLLLAVGSYEASYAGLFCFCSVPFRSFGRAGTTGFALFWWSPNDILCAGNKCICTARRRCASRIGLRMESSAQPEMHWHLSLQLVESWNAE